MTAGRGTLLSARIRLNLARPKKNPRFAPGIIRLIYVYSFFSITAGAIATGGLAEVARPDILLAGGRLLREVEPSGPRRDVGIEPALGDLLFKAIDVKLTHSRDGAAFALSIGQT